MPNPLCKHIREYSIISHLWFGSESSVGLNLDNCLCLLEFLRPHGSWTMDSVAWVDLWTGARTTTVENVFATSLLRVQQGRWWWVRKGRGGRKLKAARQERRLLPVTLLPPQSEGSPPPRLDRGTSATTPGSSTDQLTIWLLPKPRTVKRLSYKKNKASSGSSRNQSDVRWQIRTHSCSTQSPHTKFRAKILNWPQNICPHHTFFSKAKCAIWVLGKN